MTLTQTLRGMAQYLSATADPIDRERWAMTLRDTADALATAQAERDAAMNAHAGALGRIQDYILAVDAAAKQRDAALAERDRAHQSALDWKATWEMTQDKEEK